MNTVPARNIRAAVSHPLPLIAAGIIHTLSRECGIEVSSMDAGDYPEVDVVITDQETALALASQSSDGYPPRPRAKLAVIAAAGRESEVRAALEAGVQGYLLSRCSPDELILCVRRLSSGSRYLSEAAMRCIAESMAHDKLTPREITVLTLLAEGLGNKAIANRLCIGLGTVKSHVVAILDKLGVGNRTQAVTVATSRGLLCQRKGEAAGDQDSWWVSESPPVTQRPGLLHNI